MSSSKRFEVGESQPKEVPALRATTRRLVRVAPKVSVAANHAAEVAALVVLVLPRRLGEVAGAPELVVRGQMRPVRLRSRRVLDMLPAPLGQEPVVAARQQ